MKKLLTITIFALVLGFVELSGDVVLRVNTDRPIANYATAYSGTNEREHREQIIDWLENVGIRKHGKKLAAWCAAFANSMCKEKNFYLSIKSAMAKAYITKNSIKAKHVAKGYTKLDPKKDYFVIWTHGNTWKGHIGLVLEWNGTQGKTIEGNTSRTTKGSQRSGGWVSIRNRSIVDHAQFRVVYFTEINDELR